MHSGVAGRTGLSGGVGDWSSAARCSRRGALAGAIARLILTAHMGGNSEAGSRRSTWLTLQRSRPRRAARLPALAVRVPPLCRPRRCPHRAAATHAALQPWPPVPASAAAASFCASTPPWAAWQPPPPSPCRGARGATPLRPCFTAGTTCRRATPPSPRSLLWPAPRASDGLLCFDSRGGLHATIRRKGGSYLQCYRLI